MEGRGHTLSHPSAVRPIGIDRGMACAHVHSRQTFPSPSTSAVPMPAVRLRTLVLLLATAALAATPGAPAAAQGRDPVTFRGGGTNAVYYVRVRREADELRDAWLAAWEADDARALSRLVADDAVFVFTDGTTRTGRREIEADLAARLPATRQLLQKPVHFSTSGDLAYEIGTVTFLAAVEGGDHAYDGSYASVIRRRTDGTWQVLSYVVTARTDSVLVRPPPPPPPGPPATDADPATEEGAVEAAVRALSHALRARDTTAVRGLFHPGARILSLGTAGGRPAARTGTVDQLVASVAAGQQGERDERVGSAEVRVEGVLAQVWTEYTAYSGGRATDCGVAAYQLFRGADGWRIVQLTDTPTTAPCREIPASP